MMEMYSVRDVAKLFGLAESRLRYWIQSGFIWPSVRRSGQYFYTFDDLIRVRTAVELLATGLSMQKVRKGLESLRQELPDGLATNSSLRICSDGEEVVVLDGDVAYRAESKQLVMAFSVSSIQTQIAEILPIESARDNAIPVAIAPSQETTERQPLPSAYQLFLHASQAEIEGELEVAEKYLRQCIALEDSMAAAHTNLGNILYQQGQHEEAKAEYDKALIHDLEQPEARFNLANLLGEMGNIDMAIAELRHVCSRHPSFADAHYNLAVLLTQVGGRSQAEKHLQAYLEHDAESAWAKSAREYIAS